MSIKIGFILAFVWPMALAVFAQQEIFNAPIDVDKFNDPQGIEVDNYLIVKGEKEASTLFKIITPQKEVIDFTVPASGFVLIGSSSTEENITAYFSASAKPKDIQCLTLKKSNKTVNYGSLKNVESDGFLTFLNFNGKFHILRLGKKDQSLNLDSFLGDMKTDSSMIKIDDAELFSEIKSTRNFLNQTDIKPVFLPEGEASFEMARKQNKIYFRNNKLWLVMDHFGKEKDLATEMVCELDFDQHKFKKNMLSLTAEAKVDHNSFLYENTLFVLCIAKDYLIVDAFDISSLTKVKTFRQVKGLPFDFKKSYIIENDKLQGKDWEDKNNKPLDQDWEGKWSQESSSKYFFKFINGGTPVLSVSGHASDYRFLIGNYDDGRSKFNNTTSNYHHQIVEKKVYFYGYVTQSDLTPTTGKPTSHGRLSEIR
ncbi:MAG TPA: hypothetical protein VGQ59_01405, partial [Cyclobacteriaceae bacterium]|nr:hypothetical protein [Cyclobacteriaceae bacterium]